MTEKGSSAQEKTQPGNGNKPPGGQDKSSTQDRFGGFGPPDQTDCRDFVLFLERLASAGARQISPQDLARLSKMASDARYLYDWNFRVKTEPKIRVADDLEEPPEHKDFPVDLLTPSERELTLRVSESLNVSMTLPAIASLGVIAAAIGRGLYAQSGPNQILHANLYLMAIAISGVGKSEAPRPFVGPLLQKNASLISFYVNVTVPSFTSEKLRAMKERGQIESELYGRKNATLTDSNKKRLRTKHEQLTTRIYEIEDILAKPPALLTADCTEEAMGPLLAYNREQLFSYSPDAAKPVKIAAGFYNRSNEPQDSLLINGYSGDPVPVNRIGRSPIFLQRPCLSLLWLLQPIIFEKLASNSHFWQAGFLARVLIADTQLEPTEDDGKRRPIPAALLAEYESLILSLVNTYWDAKDEQEILIPPEGHELFRIYNNEVVRLRQGKYRDLTSFLARWPEQAKRIAMGQHAAIHGGEAHNEPMTLKTVENSIAIMRWFAAEQLRLLEAGRQSQLLAEMRELQGLLLSRYPGGVTLRVLQKSHGKTEEGITRIVKAFDSVFEFRQHQAPGPNGGRPSKVLKLRGGR